MRSSSACQSVSRLAVLLCWWLPMAALAQQPVAPAAAPPTAPSPQQPAWTHTAKPPSELPGARPADLAGLFFAFAKLEGLSATYSEEKHLGLLAVPLKSKGELHFLPPGTLARVVLTPEPAQLTITDKELRMADKGGTEVIDLRKSERVRTFVTSLLQVFRGDQAALQPHYRITYTPSPDAAQPRAWTLELVPTTEALQPILQRLVLTGEGVAVTRIELHEPNGDRTVTSIGVCDPARRFDEAERRRLFGDDAAPKAATPKPLDK